MSRWAHSLSHDWKARTGQNWTQDRQIERGAQHVGAIVVLVGAYTAVGVGLGTALTVGVGLGGSSEHPATIMAKGIAPTPSTTIAIDFDIFGPNTR